MNEPEYLFEIEFAIEQEGSATYVATHQTYAPNRLIATSRIKQYVKANNTRWKSFSEPRFAVISTRQLDDDAPKQPLLVLIGGTDEATPLLLPPNLRYPDRSYIIVRSPQGKRIIAFVEMWTAIGNFKGWLWARRRREWVGPYYFWPIEILGTVEAIAKGKLREAADEAMQQPPAT